MSFDTPEENRAFSEKFDFNFPLLSDTERAMGVAYGAAPDASAKHAKRIGVIIGPDGTIRDYQASVDASTFPQTVLGHLP